MGDRNLMIRSMRGGVAAYVRGGFKRTSFVKVNDSTGCQLGWSWDCSMGIFARINSDISDLQHAKLVSNPTGRSSFRVDELAGAIEAPTVVVV